MPPANRNRRSVGDVNWALALALGVGSLCLAQQAHAADWDASWAIDQAGRERELAARAFAPVAVALKGRDTAAEQAALDNHAEALLAAGLQYDLPAALALTAVAVQRASEGRDDQARSLLLRANDLAPAPLASVGLAEALASTGLPDGAWLSAALSAGNALMAFEPTAEQLKTTFGWIMIWSAAFALAALGLGLAVRWGPIAAADVVRAFNVRGVGVAYSAIWLAAGAGLLWSGSGLAAAGAFLMLPALLYAHGRERAIAAAACVAAALAGAVAGGMRVPAHQIFPAVETSAYMCRFGPCSAEHAARVAAGASEGDPASLSALAAMAARGGVRGELEQDVARRWLARGVSDSNDAAGALVLSANARVGDWTRQCASGAADASRELAVAQELYADALTKNPSEAAAKLNLSFLRAREGIGTEANSLRAQATQLAPWLQRVVVRRSLLLENGGCDTSLNPTLQLAWPAPWASLRSPARGESPVPAETMSAAASDPWIGSPAGLPWWWVALLMGLALGGRELRGRFRLAWRCVECASPKWGAPGAVLAAGPTCSACVDNRRFSPWRGPQAAAETSTQRGARRRAMGRAARILGILCPPVGLAALGRHALAWVWAVGMAVALALAAGVADGMRSIWVRSLSDALFYWAPVAAATLWAVGAMMAFALEDPEEPRGAD